MNTAQKQEYNRKYHAEHKEEAKKRYRKFMAAHPTYFSDYYQRNKEYMREMNRKWLAAHPDYHSKYYAKQKATAQ